MQMCNEQGVHAHVHPLHRPRSSKPRKRKSCVTLTLADHFQGRQEVIIADDGHSQKHVEDNHEVDDEASVLSLLHREEAVWEL